jgi:hypothetical protein
VSIVGDAALVRTVGGDLIKVALKRLEAMR